MPRTPDGKPDLRGNWSNEKRTPLERIGKQGTALTNEEAAAIEERGNHAMSNILSGERDNAREAAQTK